MLSTGQIPNVKVHGDTLSIINATASLNGAQFHCRGEDLNGNVQFWQHYSIIVSGMLLNLFGKNFGKSINVSSYNYQSDN